MGCAVSYRGHGIDWNRIDMFRMEQYMLWGIADQLSANPRITKVRGTAHQLL